MKALLFRSIPMQIKQVLSISLLTTLLCALLQSRSEAAEKLTEERFRQLHQQLQSAADEPWRTIPWRISLLQAQQIAIAEGKPIFIWAMDGHPLGCT